MRLDRASTQAADDAAAAAAASESSCDDDDGDGDVEELGEVETEFARDVKVRRSGGRPRRNKDDFHSASSSSNASSTAQR